MNLVFNQSRAYFQCRIILKDYFSLIIEQDSKYANSKPYYYNEFEKISEYNEYCRFATLEYFKNYFHRKNAFLKTPSANSFILISDSNSFENHKYIVNVK